VVALEASARAAIVAVVTGAVGDVVVAAPGVVGTRAMRRSGSL
jgi:hypothetical protein